MSSKIQLRGRPRVIDNMFTLQTVSRTASTDLFFYESNKINFHTRSQGFLTFSLQGEEFDKSELQLNPVITNNSSVSNVLYIGNKFNKFQHYFNHGFQFQRRTTTSSSKLIIIYNLRRNP